MKKITSTPITLSIIIMMTICFTCKKETLPNISCNEKSNSIDVTKKLLPATYFWAYTIVTFQGGTFVETPANTGQNYKYVFDKNGSLNYYENNVLKSVDAYVIDYEYKVTTFPSDSATIIIIQDKQSGQRKDFFRPYLCNDSAIFYNPYSSITSKRYFKRN